MAAGFLMFCAAIHSSACRRSSRPGASSCSAPMSAPGDGRVQLHVGAVESIGGVVEVSQRRAACRPRDTQSRPRSSRAIGSDHGIRSLAMRRAPARATDRNRRWLAVPRGHRQRAARSQVERLDPNDLDARQQRTPQHRLLFGEQSPRRVGVAAIERGLHAGQHRAVVLTVKALLRPSLDALDRFTLPFVRIVCRQPHEVAPGAQLGGDVQVPAAPRVGQKRRNPPRHLTELSLIHEGPDHEILRDVQFPRDPHALVAQDRQRLLGQRRGLLPFARGHRHDAVRQDGQRDRVRVSDAPSPAPSTAGRASRSTFCRSDTRLWPPTRSPSRGR